MLNVTFKAEPAWIVIRAETKEELHQQIEDLGLCGKDEQDG